MGRLDHGLRIFLSLAVATLAAGCADRNAPDDQVTGPRSHETAKIVPAQQVLAGAHVPTLDPHTMAEAEVSKVIGSGPRCEFRYTNAGSAAVGIETSANNGVIKLNGSIIALSPVVPADKARQAHTTVLAADPIRIEVQADAGQGWEPLPGVRRREATMTFKVADDLRVDYRGYVDCSSKPIRISHRR